MFAGGLGTIEGGWISSAGFGSGLLLSVGILAVFSWESLCSSTTVASGSLLSEFSFFTLGDMFESCCLSYFPTSFFSVGFTFFFFDGGFFYFATYSSGGLLFV